MMVIAHLYYDLLNLYGENGNVKILKKQLQDQGLEVVVKKLSINDQLDFASYDFVYIGAGTEYNQKLALNHLLNYKQDIKVAIDKNKFFLVTGNAVELFGKHIIDLMKHHHPALNIFDYTAKEENFRIADEVLFASPFITEPILGFQNQNSTIRDNNKYIFNILRGTGSYPGSKGEGIHYNNFYGTYVIGPILVRNPEFLKYLIKELVYSKNKDFKFKKFNLTIEESAYKCFIMNNYEDTKKA